MCNQFHILQFKNKLAMKKLTIIYSIFAICTIFTTAQTQQNGIIQEYNESAKKTALPGVEINVRSANSTVSGKDGSFTLQFLTLSPGEKVNVRRIEKLGYEVFNKEAIEQWNINPKMPFVIIMCRSDRFKKIRDNYERISSESYARQLKKDEAALAKLKADGKLKEADYQKQLYELRENYERQLDNIESYVDRFSRIDLSELSNTEKEIIELVQQGKIEEAIAKYEEQNFTDKYIDEVTQIKEISSAIDQLSDIKQLKQQSRDSLLAAIDRQIETLKLAGGKENFDKIGVILKDVAMADTLNIINARKYADFLYDLKAYQLAYPIYVRLESICANIKERQQALIKMININKVAERYDSALEQTRILENLILQHPSYFSTIDHVQTLILQGQIYGHKQDIDSSKKAFLTALKHQDACPLKILAHIKNGLSNILSLEHKYDEALSLYLDVEQIYDSICDNSTESYCNIAMTSLNIAQTYESQKNYLLAKKHIAKSLEFISRSYNHNPDKYRLDYSNVLNTAGNICSEINLFEEAEKFYTQSSEIVKPLYETYPTLFWRQYYPKIGNLAILYTSTKEYSKAIEIFNYVITIIKNAPESNFRNKTLSETIYNASYIYCKIEKYDWAIKLLNESLYYAKSLFDYNKRYGAFLYLSPLSNLAYCYNKINKPEKAKETYINGIGTIESLELKNISPFSIRYANLNYNLAHHYHYYETNYSLAISHYLKAYSIYSTENDTDNMITSSIGLADCYLSINNLSDASVWILKHADSETARSTIDWLHTRGMIAMAISDLETAQMCREQILLINPDIDVSNMPLFNNKDLQ